MSLDMSTEWVERVMSKSPSLITKLYELPTDRESRMASEISILKDQVESLQNQIEQMQSENNDYRTQSFMLRPELDELARQVADLRSFKQDMEARRFGKAEPSWDCDIQSRSEDSQRNIEPHL